MTGALLNIDIRGCDGRKLAEDWADGPKACLGLALAGFPNLFTVNGPGSPSLLTNMVVACEQHVEWICDLIDYARSNGIIRVEATAASQQQ